MIDYIKQYIRDMFIIDIYVPRCFDTIYTVYYDKDPISKVENYNHTPKNNKIRSVVRGK